MKAFGIITTTSTADAGGGDGVVDERLLCPRQCRTQEGMNVFASCSVVLVVQ